MSTFTKIMAIAAVALALFSLTPTGYTDESRAYIMSLPAAMRSSIPSLAPLRLAFISDNDIYVMQGDLSQKRRLTNDLAYEHGLAWSPDGRRIAYLSELGQSVAIGVVTTDGLSQSFLVSDSADAEPVWSPDGASMVFVSTRDGNREVYRMKADGSEQTRLTATSADEYCPTWSPDGTRIAFSSDRDETRHIYIMKADGSEQTRLTTTSAKEICPAWSPDGTRVAFVSLSDNGTKHLDVIRLGNSVITPLFTISSAPYGITPYNLEWSPDSTQIAFNVSGRAAPGMDQEPIYLIKADGSEAYPRTIATGKGPTWSPDGAWIAYTYVRTLSLYTALSYIEVIDENGTQHTRLTTQGHEFGPQWAPQLPPSP